MSTVRPADTVRPRYGRITAFSGSVAVTLVAVLGGVGVLPSGGAPSYAVPGPDSATLSAQERTLPAPGGAGTPHAEPPPADGGTDSSVSRVLGDPASPMEPGGPGESAGDLPAAGVPVPPDSGTGRRVVFDQSDQRVWLVRADGTAARTYLVSGSLTDNLQPGTYQVYSRSEQAYGFEDSGRMRYFVRFAHGVNAAIGFHDIPVLDGELVQTRAELGTPQSHGCVRQWRPDAKAMWRFAPLGTTVVVTA